MCGKTTSSSGAQSNDFQFAGQQTDGTGLQYLRARYYDPETGGFLGREPMALLPSWGASSYAYALGRPTSLTDPDGTLPQPPHPGCDYAYDDTYPIPGCPHSGVPSCEFSYAHPCDADLIGEYILNTIAGCEVDHALCVAALGTQAATMLIGGVITTGLAGACVESGGIVCILVVRGGSWGIHTITFYMLNGGLGGELRAKGKAARGK